MQSLVTTGLRQVVYQEALLASTTADDAWKWHLFDLIIVDRRSTVDARVVVLPFNDHFQYLLVNSWRSMDVGGGTIYTMHKHQTNSQYSNVSLTYTQYLVPSKTEKMKRDHDAMSDHRSYSRYYSPPSNWAMRRSSSRD